MISRISEAGYFIPRPPIRDDTFCAGAVYITNIAGFEFPTGTVRIPVESVCKKGSDALLMMKDQHATAAIQSATKY
jgi:hypothetical protein